MAENPTQKADMIFRAVWNNAQKIVGEQGGDILGKVTETAVKPVVRDDAIAKRAGEFADAGFRATTAVSANVRDFALVAKNSRKRVGALLDDVEPFLVDEFGKSSRGKLMRSDNEVISHKRRQLMGQTKFGVFKATSGLTDKLPEVMELMEVRRNALESKGGADADELSASVDNILPEDTGNQVIDDARERLEQRMDTLAASEMFSPENRRLIETGIRTAAPALQEYFENEGADRFAQNCAFDMIKDLSEQAQSGKGNVSVVFSEATGDHLPLADYVIEIFKQHQVDVGGTPLNDRFRFMPELRDACARIAEEIDKNLLDPMALVALVGNRKVLDKHLKVADPTALDDALGEVWSALERTENIDTQEFISETAFATKGDFKQIIKDMPEADKPFFASLFPIPVLREMGGLKDSEIDKLRSQGASEFSDRMVEAIQDISRLDEKELQHYGLTKEEGSLIRELADVIDVAGAQEVKDELHGDLRKNVTEAVRNARGYWQDRVAGRTTGSLKLADGKDEPAEEEQTELSHVRRLREDGRASGEIER